MHAHAENPVEAFGRLFHSARKPPLMAEGKMEHRIVMHHLLIHGDNVQAEGGYARCCCCCYWLHPLPFTMHALYCFSAVSCAVNCHSQTTIHLVSVHAISAFKCSIPAGPSMQITK